MIKVKNRHFLIVKVCLVPVSPVDRPGLEEMRARILEVAWELFRQLGARTTIADIAEKLGMSSANVYRFYSSKQAVCEAIASNQLGALTASAREIAARSGPAKLPRPRRPTARARSITSGCSTSLPGTPLN